MVALALAHDTGNYTMNKREKRVCHGHFQKKKKEKNLKYIFEFKERSTMTLIPFPKGAAGAFQKKVGPVHH